MTTALLPPARAARCCDAPALRNHPRSHRPLVNQRATPLRPGAPHGRNLTPAQGDDKFSSARNPAF